MAKLPKDCMPMCATCAFADIKKREDEGYCRRYPATVVVVNEGIYSALAVVKRDSWCGEFVRATN